ncbi:MAG: flagellar protein FlgN [Clostridiaceae bacterium]
MKEQLMRIMEGEKKALEDLINLLEEQHKFILNSDAFNLDAIVVKIKNTSIEIAKYETERRQLTGETPMSEIIKNLNDENAEKLLEEIKMLLEKASVQKDTNELLIKQSLVFVNKMLNYINPNREIKTYNAYGKVRR